VLFSFETHLKSGHFIYASLHLRFLILLWRFDWHYFTPERFCDDTVIQHIANSVVSNTTPSQLLGAEHYLSRVGSALWALQLLLPLEDVHQSAVAFRSGASGSPELLRCCCCNFGCWHHCCYCMLVHHSVLGTHLVPLATVKKNSANTFQLLWFYKKNYSDMMDHKFGYAWQKAPIWGLLVAQPTLLIRTQTDISSPWRRRQHWPPKHWYPTTTLHGVTSQKTSKWYTNCVWIKVW
jgi:hypothetical protein